MHQAVLDFVSTVLHVHGMPDDPKVLEFGSRDLNGSVRPLFGKVAEYVGVDYQAGLGVDIVDDAATFYDNNWYDVVVCTEVLEHYPNPALIVANAKRHLNPDGLFIATMAAPGREPHSAIVEGPPQPGEWYANISKHHMVSMLESAGFVEWSVTQVGVDLQVWAR